MTPNTRLRTVSAVVLLFWLCCVFIVGRALGAATIIILSLLLYYELMQNFFKISLRSGAFWLFGGILLALELSFFALRDDFIFHFYFQTSAAFFHLVLFIFLLQYQTRPFEELAKAPVVSLFFIVWPLSCLGFLLHFEQWREMVFMLMFVVFFTDTTAWFFGRKFGRTPLWPEVSPKKTREGALWAAFVTSLASGLLVSYLSSKVIWSAFVAFFIFSVLSQIGDLVQSRMKREFGLKDSSSLIPGHGGVYDRLDGLLFVTPFYALYTYSQAYLSF